ncbi:hypothetical protein J0H58_39140 [bacterium]|nr:hypothetical protein [bacterium]
MTAATLSRHYPALKPDERLALMLAAAARGDDLDHARLVAAAPRVTFTTLDTFPRALAFREVLDRFRAERLDLAARYFHTRSLAAGAAGRGRERFDGVVRVYGDLLLAYRDGGPTRWSSVTDGLWSCSVPATQRRTRSRKTGMPPAAICCGGYQSSHEPAAPQSGGADSAC